MNYRFSYTTNYFNYISFIIFLILRHKIGIYIYIYNIVIKFKYYLSKFKFNILISIINITNYPFANYAYKLNFFKSEISNLYIYLNYKWVNFCTFWQKLLLLFFLRNCIQCAGVQVAL